MKVMVAIIAAVLLLAAARLEATGLLTLAIR